MSCENGVLTLDDGFSEKLSRVLSDPEALKRISDIASGLGTSPRIISICLLCALISGIGIAESSALV